MSFFYYEAEFFKGYFLGNLDEVPFFRITDCNFIVVVFHLVLGFSMKKKDSFSLFKLSFLTSRKIKRGEENG